MKIPTLRSILKTKKEPHVQDPPRYPEIINSYEDEAKRIFTATLQKTIAELGKEMSVSLKEK